MGIEEQKQRSAAVTPEEALRQSEGRLQSILDSMADLVFVLDKEGRFTGYHGQASELYTDPAIFLGKKYSEIMPLFITELVAPALAANRQGRRASVEYSLSVPSGLQHYSAKLSPIMLDGSYTGSVMVAHNITDLRKAADDLIASEEKYRALVENINDVIYTLDNEGIITYVSPVVERFTGYKVSDLLGKPFMPIIYPDDLPGLLGSLDRLMDGKLEPWEFRVLDKDGRIIWVRSSSRPVYEDGRVVGITAMMTDITRYKEAEQALRESQDRFNLTIEAIKDGIWDWNFATNEAVFSANCYKILGYEPGELPANYATFTHLMHPEDVAEALNKIDSSLKNDTPYAVELRLRKKSGEWCWVLSRGMSVEKDDSGRPIRMVGTLSDISQRKQGEKVIEEQRKEYRTILDAVPSIIAYVDKNGRFMRINQAAAGALGVQPKDAIGKTFYDFFTTDDANRFISRCVEAVNSAKPIFASISETKLPSGRRISTQTDIIPFLDHDGKASGTINIVQDITARLHAEVALKKSEERFRNLASLLPETVFETDAASNFIFVNRRGYEMFGYTEEDVKAGLNVLKMIVEEDRERAVANIADRIKGREPSSNEYIALRKDGSTFPCIIFGATIMHDGVYAGLRGILIDISERKQMEQRLEHSIAAIGKTLNDAVITMGKIVEMKDPYTAGHQLRVARLAAAIAGHMQLPAGQVENIRTAAAIHDIGKIYVPSDILAKPGKLNDMEISIIRTHAQGSFDILANIDFPGPIARIAQQHHERLDGSGYPSQLKGDDICLEARILTVADVVEAMSSHRPYRPSLGIEAALEEIAANSGKFYDKAVVEACLALFREKGFKFDESAE